MSTSLGLWRQANRVEGFQTATPTLAELQTQAKAALAEFFPVWKNYLTSGLPVSTDLSGIVNTTWAGYVSAITADYTGANFGSLIIKNIVKTTVNITYNNPTTSTTIAISNIIINNNIFPSSSSTSLTVNAQTLIGYVAPRYDCVDFMVSPYNIPGVGTRCIYKESSSMAVIKLNSTDVFTLPKTIYGLPTKFAVGYRTPTYYPGNPGTLVNGSGTISMQLSWNEPTIINSLTFKQVPQIITGITLESMTGTITTSLGTTSVNFLSSQQNKNSIEKFIKDFNNSYATLLIDLYTNVLARHSTNPPVAFTAPSKAPTNAATDRTNAMAGTNIDVIKSSYLTEYLPALYSSILEQTKAYYTLLKSISSDLFSTTSSSILDDFTTLNAFSSSTDVTKDIMTITGLFAKYNYTSILKQAAQVTITRFYRDTVIPYKRYLMNDDISSSISVAIKDSVTYFSLAGNTAQSAFNGLSNAKYIDIHTQMKQEMRNVVKALLNRLNSVYTTWRGYGMPIPATPADFDSYMSSYTSDLAQIDKTTGSAIRDKICGTGGYWPALVTAMQAFIAPKMSLLQNTYTFATQSATTAIALNALGTNAATVGLGQLAPPLVFTQPTVTGTGTLRTFYGIILNNGMASSSTLLNSYGFVWGTTSNSTENTINLPSTTVSTLFIGQPTFSTVPAVGTVIYVRAFASNSSKQITYGNEITFVY